jgi:hypothetical protein
VLVVKDKPVGVDIPVQGFQKFLYPKLKALWNLSDSEMDGYGRCYRNKVDKGYIPQLFDGGTVYKDVFFDDTNSSALFFFDLEDVRQGTAATSSTKVDMIFMVNVQKIKPGLSYRGDEEIRVDVERLCLVPRFNMKMVAMCTGFKNVFSRFDGVLTADQVTFRDLHPLHVFKISFELIYSINAC